MDILIYLIPITFFLSLVAIGGYIWCVKTNQYEDIDGAANRILFDDDKP